MRKGCIYLNVMFLKLFCVNTFLGNRMAPVFKGYIQPDCDGTLNETLN